MNILLNILIISLPFGVIIRLTLFNNVHIYPVDIISGIILALVLFNVFVNRSKIEQKKLFVMSVLFILIGLVSLFINSLKLTSQELLTALGYLIRLAAFFSIPFAVLSLDAKYQKGLIFKLIAAGVVFTLFGFIQYHFYPSLRNLFYLGWDEHLYRLFSTFLDPNFAGTFLVLILLLITGYFIESYKKHSLTKRLVYVLFMLTILIAIYLTYSRSAFIMLLVSTSVLLFLYKKFKEIILITVFLISLLFLYSNSSIEGLNPLRTVSSEARLKSANDAWNISLKNPILGVGFNAYRYAQVDYGTRIGPGVEKSNADAGTDNSYLFVLATTGIVGFLVYFDLLINYLKVLYRQIDRTYTKVAFASLIGLMINTIFINALFYPSILVWMMILLGVTVSKKR